MKITQVEAFALQYPLREPIRDATHDLAIFELAVVRLHADDGLVGHGYSAAMHGGASVIALLTREILAPILVGRDPFHVRGLWDEMFWRSQIVSRAGTNRIAMGAAATVANALQRRNQLAPLRAAARKHIVKHYDLKTQCLPAQIKLMHSLAKKTG